MSATQTTRPKPLHQVREAIRVRHCSIRTEEGYVQWVKRYVLFHNKHHPAERPILEEYQITRLSPCGLPSRRSTRAG
ncbi:MAG: phage integrase N-terminal SAM-like domain-containing protein [bacterium]